MKRAVDILLAIFIVGFLCAGLGAQNKKSETKIKQQIKAVRAKEATGREKLKAVRKEMRTVKYSLEELDDRLDQVERAFHAAEDKLERNERDRQRLIRELAQAQKEYEVKSQVAKDRLRAIRLRGSASVLTAMVGVSDLGDLASRRFIFARMAARDRALFEEVKRLRNQIAANKKRTEGIIAETKQLLVQQRARHAELNEIRGDKQIVLNQLSERAEDLEKYVKQMDNEEEALRRKLEESSFGPGSLGSRPGRLFMPTRGRIGSGFGMRRHPILGRARMHWGQDIAAPSGTPIYSAAAGTVTYAARQRGYGNVVIVQHGGGMSTLYAHCSAILVRVGQRVGRGQIIARVGSTGLSTGPHLHFEVAINGRRVNPRGYL